MSEQIELKISVKLGAINIELEQPADSYLVGISASLFAQKVLELNDYIGTRAESENPSSRRSYVTDGQRVDEVGLWDEHDGDPMTDANVVNVVNLPPLPTSRDGSVLKAEVSSSPTSLRSSDKMLAEFLDEDMK